MKKRSTQYIKSITQFSKEDLGSDKENKEKTKVQYLRPKNVRPNNPILVEHISSKASLIDSDSRESVSSPSLHPSQKSPKGKIIQTYI